MNVPQLVKRKVGEVKIIDLKGEFVGPWAVRGREEISSYLGIGEERNILFNLKGVTSIDSLGVKALLESIPSNYQVGFLMGSLTVMEMFDQFPQASNLKWLRSEDEVVSFFGQKLVQSGKRPGDKRKYPRLKIALPVEFYCINPEGSEVHFHGIATDLSEGGLFIEYLDLEMVNQGLHYLNPYDFRLLFLTLHLHPYTATLEVRGKVAHVEQRFQQIGMGIEFYELPPPVKEKIRKFLQGERPAE